MFKINRGDIRFREIKPNFLSLIVLNLFPNIYIIFMEYFLNEFMYSHTHIYLMRFLFFFFFIKGEENEGVSMTKV
jgi:hypothetical protein